MKPDFQGRTCGLKVLKILEDMKKGQIMGSTNIATASFEAIRSHALESNLDQPLDFGKELSAGCTSLFLKAQPSNVLLTQGVHYIIQQVGFAIDEGRSVEELKRVVSSSVDHLTKSITESIDKIGQEGSKLLSDGDVIMTHGCSTSVLSIIGKTSQIGKKTKVIVTENRPQFLGRLFAYAAADLGIPVTLVVDSATPLWVKKVNKVFLGAMAVSPTGRIVGSLGTLAMAIAAHEAQVPVYVAASTLKFSDERLFAYIDEMRIEEGDPSYVFSSPAVEGIEVSNPLYDVTPAKYVHLIITEKGAIPPRASMQFIRDFYRTPPPGQV